MVAEPVAGVETGMAGTTLRKRALVRRPGVLHTAGMNSLEGRIALVTGASRGIGRATALALASRGARVTVCSRRGEALESLVAEMPVRAGHAVAADLTSAEAVRDAFAETAGHWGGRLDILVNAAGLARIAPVSDGDPADWEAMWRINVHGLALCSREALRWFPEEGGHIVNLASLSGHRVPGVGGFYSATKFAVRAMSEAMRVELRAAKNATRITALSPGFVDTELVDEYLAARGMTRDDLGYRLIPPEEVARAVVHVLEAPAEVEVNDILFRPRDQAV